MRIRMQNIGNPKVGSPDVPPPRQVRLLGFWKRAPIKVSVMLMKEHLNIHNHFKTLWMQIFQAIAYSFGEKLCPTSHLYWWDKGCKILWRVAITEACSVLGASMWIRGARKEPLLEQIRWIQGSSFSFEGFLQTGQALVRSRMVKQAGRQ